MNDECVYKMLTIKRFLKTRANILISGTLVCGAPTGGILRWQNKENLCKNGRFCQIKNFSSPKFAEKEDFLRFAV